jgi:hypothetical protein
VSGADLDVWYGGGGKLEKGGEVMEAIIDHQQGKDKKCDYLVTWEGFKEKQNSSWVREANFGEKNPALLRGPLKAESRLGIDVDEGRVVPVGPKDKVEQSSPGLSAVE